MDQMLALREQNARLHRRVRDLEHFSNLEKLRKQLQEEAVEEDFAEWDKDAAFAESIFENIFSGQKRLQLYTLLFKGRISCVLMYLFLRIYRNKFAITYVGSDMFKIM